jgi:predicted dithiol-disulfide oxidoreductase (DUF899 family)
MYAPHVVSDTEWAEAIQEFRAEEKRATRERDALAARRRRLPAVAMERSYRFHGPDGDVALLDLFDGRRQLLLYHFMFAPEVHGWPDAGCPGCSMFIDQIGHPAHLNARDTSLAIVSRAPLKQLEEYRQRMGWSLPWYSSADSEFNRDLGLTTDAGETFALSVFYRDGERILRTYVTAGRGVETLGSVWSFLDLTPLGRHELWEDAPAGVGQDEPFLWWRRHDEYQSVVSP